MAMNSVCKVYPLTNKRKKRIHASILEKRDEIFDIDYLKNALQEINTIEEINLSKLLKINFNEYNKCIFINNNFGWLSINEKGKQRYFTKNKLTYSLDIYDLLSIYFNCNYNQLINYLIDYGYNPVDCFKKEQLLKHELNNKCVSDLISDNSTLNKLLSDKIEIYKALNDFAKNNSLGLDRYNNNSIFFISTRYLKEMYDLSYSISTINQTINLYAVLGLIDRIPQDKITSEVYKAYCVNKKKAPINFYAIPNISKVKKEVECMGLNFTSSDMSYYKMNKYKNLKSYKIKQIPYSLNRGGGDKTKRSKQAKQEKFDMEMFFYQYLKEYDVVAKEWIKNEPSITLSNTAFDKKWKELIKKNEGRSVKPTKRLREKYNLKSNQEIFIKK